MFELLDFEQVEKQLSSYTISAIEDFFLGLPMSNENVKRDSSWATSNTSFAASVDIDSDHRLPTEEGIQNCA